MAAKADHSRQRRQEDALLRLLPEMRQAVRNHMTRLAGLQDTSRTSDLLCIVATESIPYPSIGY